MLARHDAKCFIGDSFPKLAIREKAFNGRGITFHIVGSDKQPGYAVAHDLRNPADVRCDDGNFQGALQHPRFERDAVPGLLGMAEIEAELSALLGRPVDLRTANELSPHFRQAVERAAEVRFAA